MRADALSALVLDAVRGLITERRIVTVHAIAKRIVAPEEKVRACLERSKWEPAREARALLNTGRKVPR